MKHGYPLLMAGAAAFLAGASCVQAAGVAAATPQFTRCEASENSIEYRSEYPDGQRFLFVTVKVLKGVHPSIFVFIDKNFVGKGVDLSKKTDPLVAWWLDRSRPMSFSADKIKIGWMHHGAFHFITGLFTSDDPSIAAQSIRGLVRVGDHFEGAGNSDNNNFAFQSRLELPDYEDDELSVFVPAVTYDGVTVAAPEIHFTNTDEAPAAKC